LTRVRAVSNGSAPHPRFAAIFPYRQAIDLHVPTGLRHTSIQRHRIGSPEPSLFGKHALKVLSSLGRCAPRIRWPSMRVKVRGTKSTRSTGKLRSTGLGAARTPSRAAGAGDKPIERTGNENGSSHPTMPVPIPPANSMFCRHQALSGIGITAPGVPETAQTVRDAGKDYSVV
jgi:hypothetical protein